MQPRLNARCSDCLAEYLHAGFKVRRIGNTCNAASSAMVQMMAWHSSSSAPVPS